MKLTTPAFKHDGPIPDEYTCVGDNVNPELHIADIPKGTKSLALLLEDPDAPSGMFVHWVVWNISADTKKIPKNAEPPGVQGLTDFRTVGYGGPCPTPGTHRYFFKIFALDTVLDLPEKASKKELEAAMQGHEIEHVELIGLYSKG